MAIYDCFLFYNEMTLLEIRLNELYPYVDHFVLVEATHTFSGRPKPMYFDQIKHNAKIAPFADKIIYVKFNITRPSDDRWENEISQRNALSQGLTGANPDDTIIISDVDEIINPQIMEIVRENSSPGRLLMKNYYYYFNCRCDTDWHFPAFCRYKDFTTAQDLRNGDHHKIMVFNGGWHFGYLMSPEDIADKLSSFSHDEYDTQYFKDTTRIRDCMEKGVDLFGRNGVSYSITNLDAPKYVMNHQDKFASYIR